MSQKMARYLLVVNALGRNKFPLRRRKKNQAIYGLSKMRQVHLKMFLFWLESCLNFEA
jgi:hypothetical protein